MQSFKKERHLWTSNLKSGFSYAVTSYFMPLFVSGIFMCRIHIKPHHTGYYLLFTISILDLKNKGNGQVYTIFLK